MPMAFFFCFSSIPFCILPPKYAYYKREKRVWHLQENASSCNNAIIITCRDRMLAASPHWVTFPHLKLKCSFYFLSFFFPHPFRESLKPPVVKCRIVNGEFLFALRNWMFSSSLSNSRCLKLCVNWLIFGVAFEARE